MGKKQLFLFNVVSVVIICTVLLLSVSAGQVDDKGRARPTFSDVAYGKHERNKLDFWKAESGKPAPLVVVFHGGGFRKGDKSAIHGWKFLDGYLPKGVSFASVNYPFLSDANNDYFEVMKHCRRAVEFIIANADKWNVDKNQIAVYGSSAGALISEWLGCNMTNISAVGAYQQPLGTAELILPCLKPGCPPVYVFQTSGADDLMHSSRNATMLKMACDEKKIDCQLWGNRKNGFASLPSGKSPTNLLMEFLFKVWKTHPGEQMQ